MLGQLHAPCGFGVAPESGDALQSGQGEAGTQVLLGLGQQQERLQRGLVAAVAPAFPSLRVHLDIGLRTGAVIVQIRVEVCAVELLDGVGVGRLNMAPAHMFADDGTVLGLRQPIVVGMSGTAFGLFDHQLVQQSGYGLIDELAAVVGVKAVNHKGKLGQHRDEHRFQIGFGDARHRCRNLPLRDLIDGVDVIHALGMFRVALVHRIHPQIARAPSGIGTAALANGHRAGPRLLIVLETLAVARSAA